MFEEHEAAGASGFARHAGGWLERTFFWVDDHMLHMGRNIAHRCHENFLPFLLILIGAFLIATVSELGSTLKVLVTAVFHAQQEPFFESLLWVPFCVLFIWLIGRLFVGVSSRIVVSRLDRVKGGDAACKVLVVGLSPLPEKDLDDAIKEAEQWSARWQVYAGPANDWWKEAGGQLRGPRRPLAAISTYGRTPHCGRTAEAYLCTAVVREPKIIRWVRALPEDTVQKQSRY